MYRTAEVDPRERLARQRKLLQKKLGLDMGAAIGMDTEELFNDEDLDYTCASNVNRSQTGKGVTFQSFRSHAVRLNYCSSHFNEQTKWIP